MFLTGGEQNPSKRQRQSKQHHSRSVLPMQSLKSFSPNLKLLLKQAKLKDTNVLLQPHGMSKRKENTSRVDRKTGIIFWHLTVVFALDSQFTMDEVLSYDAGLKKLDSLRRSLVGFYVKDAREDIILKDLVTKIFCSLPVCLIPFHVREFVCLCYYFTVVLGWVRSCAPSSSHAAATGGLTHSNTKSAQSRKFTTLCQRKSPSHTSGVMISHIPLLL